MPRSLWNGTISVGVIAVPVKLYTAVETRTVRFREVHLEDGAKIEHRRFCSKEGKEVPYDDVVKGYETSKGRYVVLEKDEIAAAAAAHCTSPRTTRHQPIASGTPSQSATEVPKRAHSCAVMPGSSIGSVVRVWSTHGAIPSMAGMLTSAANAIGIRK